MSDLKGTAVVTGATGGLGALYAAGLAERGYDLLLVGRQQQTLDAVAKAVKQKANVKVDSIVANLAEAKGLARVEARISSDPAITALINSATAVTFSPLAKLGSQALDETIAVNITALTRLTHAVLPGLLARGAGAIVNFASVLAFHPWPEFSVYNASKAYVVSFSQALQGEVAGKGVLVQVVTPPAVDTNFWNQAGLPVSNLPAGAVMKPQHLVDAALKGLDRGESWVFPSLPEQTLWDDHQKTRQALVGGLMNGAPAARYAA
ncbi:MAG: SDR family NAD(P)-dependent oxidoreductase [Bradyrhizobium sp.]|jgi:short-subunit dehydrogenase|uniref:SDR family NAD(P)-dependent oxidoreductase n=1 Tax=Bradyrhizobium sp. TaxID=376 RepID=UPI0011FA291F|nr:SDR family NAD(P)-dependent oxidoreductase [Bradyrhizobium sp.]THD48449.1 MAG: SDR family NAD(P)-dependent oxidoreductase [Bradyrhizobium sp.]